MRRGFLSKDEKDFIKANITKLRTEDIAGRLNRTVKIVADYISKNLDVPKMEVVLDDSQDDTSLANPVSEIHSLESSEEWKRVKSELMPDEIKFFKEKYSAMVKQFKGDILATECSQIVQAIKFEILMSRNLVERKRSREDIERLQYNLNKYLEGFNNDINQMNDSQRDFMMNMEVQLQSAKQAEQARTSEYVKLQERFDALMKTLKGTRDQRFKQTENSRTSYIGFIKELHLKKKLEQEGRFAELYRMAGEKAYKELGELHTYEDGQVDRPILSAETV